MNQEELEKTINSWWDGEKPRGGIQDRPRDKPRDRIQDTPRDRPRIQDTPRDRVRDSIQDRPRHEVRDRIRDRDPRDRTILQDPPKFDRENLRDSMIRRDRPRAPKHPLDDPWSRNRAPRPRKSIPVIDHPFDDPLPRNDLIEIFPGVFRTPEDPVDPRNCRLYPDSPWCGGFPFTVTPIGLEPKIVVDECAIGFRVEPVVGFTNMPPVEIQYRRAGKCREREEPDIPDKPQPPPVNWPPGNLEDPCVIVFSEKATTTVTAFLDGKLIHKEELISVESSSQYEPCVYEKNGFGFDTLVPLKYFYSKKTRDKGRTLYAGEWLNWDRQGAEEYIRRAGISTKYKDVIEDVEFHLKNSVRPGTGALEYNGLKIIEWVDSLGREFKEFTVTTTQYTVDAFYQPVCQEQPVPPPPYPPQRLNDEECRCMRCCNDSKGSNNNLDDLKVLINQLHKKIGTGAFKVTIPDADPFKKGNQSLTLTFENLSHALNEIITNGRYDRIDNARLEAGLGLENFPAKAPAWLNALDQADIEINSMPEYLAYIVKQMDAVLGQFPIKIKIKDSDLTKEGNQEINLNIPNLAEGIAELLGLALTTRTDVDATLNAAIRNLVETGSTRQQVFLAYQLAMANAEFLGYKLEHKKIKVPFAFTPGKTRLDEILKESEQTIVGFENTDSQDFRDIIAPLLELAAMWKAQNFKRVDPIHTAADLLSILKDGKELYESLTTEKKEKEEMEGEKWDNSWDEFQRHVEQGWTQASGISDIVNPYGRNFSERPRIRELGDTSDGDTNAN